MTGTGKVRPLVHGLELLGSAAALLLAPASGEKTRRKLVRKREEVGEYLIDAGKELVEKCEDLYERSGELAGRPTLISLDFRRSCPTFRRSRRW
jgi:hypothetical protein